MPVRLSLHNPIKKLAACLPLCLSLSCSLVPNNNSNIANQSAPNTFAQIEITSALPSPLTQEPIYLSFYELGLPEDNRAFMPLGVFADNSLLAHDTIDINADGKTDGILFALDLPSPQPRQIRLVRNFTAAQPTVKKLTQAQLAIKQGGTWQGKYYSGGDFVDVQQVTPPPQYTDHSNWIRFEGPGIESDKVAYRVYLDWRNGFDIFGKKQPALALQSVGLKDYQQYHQDAPWGQDILKVGKSLGLGGFGFWNGKSAELVSKTSGRQAIVTNNGNIYSSFRINYQNWSVNNKPHQVSADISMYAGSRLAKVHLHTDKSLENFALGLVKSPGTQIIEGPSQITGSAYTYFATWGPQSLSRLSAANQPDNLGLAIIFRRGDRQQQVQDEHSHVAVMNTNGGDLDYYFVAAWDQEHNGIKSLTEFQTYLDREIERLTFTPRKHLHFTALKNHANTITAEQALNWSKNLADSELARKTLNYYHGGWDANRKRPPKFEYDIIGMQIHALQELNKIQPAQRYTDALTTVTGSYVNEIGEIATFDPKLFSIDAIKPGQMLIELEQQTGQLKYRKAVDYLRQQLKIHPRTREGAFWHRATYPHQLWLDGVYMGMPFLAQYAALYETGAAQQESFHEVVQEFLLARKYLRNSATGLYYHAWDESKQAIWADKTRGTSPHYWSRAMGWYAMALVDVLDYLPVEQKHLRAQLISIIEEFAVDILLYQDKATGTWWQLTDAPNEAGNYRESSASAMFSYFLLKAVNKGYLTKRYRAPALASYTALVTEFISQHADGKISMNNQCHVAGLGFGRDGSKRYYLSEPIISNDPKGNVPFILAGIEAYKLLR